MVFWHFSNLHDGVGNNNLTFFIAVKTYAKKQSSRATRSVRRAERRWYMFTTLFQFLAFHQHRLLVLTTHWLYYVSIFIIGKILCQNLKIHLKESIYIALASFCLTVCVRFPLIVFMFTGLSTRYQPVSFFVQTASVLTLAFLFIYFKWIKSYPATKTVILAIFTTLFIRIASTLVSFVYLPFNFVLSPSGLGFPPHHRWQGIASSLLTLVFSVLVAFLTVKISGKIRKQINASTHMQLVLMIGAVIVYLLNYIINFMTPRTTWINPVFTIISFGYIVASLLSFVAYTWFLNAKRNLAQKEEEQKYLQFYASEMEQQQLAIRKFKHDQQNLFAAIDIYIKNNDLEGLKEFYPNVRTASEVITKNEFELEGLAKIKKQEIKNIFIAKLVVAQNLGIDIKLEIREEIDDILIDSIAMVRMLGIILDNAIEELQALGEGELMVVCINAENHISITVQNTCKVDIPPLKQLKQSGFSTKGEGRGLGLSNLYELIDALPNVSLMTGIDSGNFTQALTIER